MKTNSYVSTLAVIILVTALLNSCGFLQPEYLPVSRRVIIIDNTDKFTIRPSEALSTPTCSESTLSQARWVVIRPITSIATNRRLDLELPAYRQFGVWDESWAGYYDEEYRTAQIEDFEALVRSKVEEVSTAQVGYGNTALLSVLIDELSRLSACPNDDRSIVIFSDLGEHSKENNWLLGSSEFKRLERDDTTVWSGIEGTIGLDLSGITIELVFQPNERTEHAYLVRANYLKRRLEEIGGTVIIRTKVEHIMMES